MGMAGRRRVGGVHAGHHPAGASVLDDGRAVAFLDKTLVQEHFSVIGGLIVLAILAQLKFREGG